MTDDELRKLVLDALAGVAPELDPATLKPDKSLRDQLDIDSMDFLNFMIALNEALGVDIPETDQPKLVTLDGAVAYLGGKLMQRA
ncbi:MAG: phosphopantetheine-binding protein [Alphaproteobacteria bacterium]|nr:phosphopantetheine-binding protein [Alphaproteobacteria bacterium]